MSEKEIVDITDLKQDTRNANKGTDRGQLMVNNSINENGAGRSVLTDRDGNIIAGNKTVRAATIAGLDVQIVRTDGTKLIAVMREDLDIDSPEARRLAIADNRTSEVGLEWDSEELSALIADGVDVGGMFDDFELEDLGVDFDSIADDFIDGDAEPEISRADELRDEWGVELGQLWILPSRTAGQEHRLICGDCTDAGVVERVMGGEKAVVIFTDPPYGVSIGKKNVMLNSFQPSGRNLTDIVSDDLSPDELKKILTPAFSNAKSVMADDCSVFVTAPQGGDLGMMMMMMMMEAGLAVRHVLTWVKNAPTFSMGRLDYDYKHEPILFTWGKKHRKNKGDGFGNSCWEIAKPRSSADHPTMKPPELYEQAYGNHSDVGDIVYEPFSGSGTSFIAAENLARQCRAVEISPSYVAVALQRYQDAFGITPHLYNGA